MNYLITGGTGFVGEKLVHQLHEYGHHTYILTRSPEAHTNTEQATYIGYNTEIEKLLSFQGVVNLAGESLFGYWTEKKKKQILKSRIDVTEKLLGILQRLPEKPDVLVSGSAVGYYGMSDEVIFTEQTRHSSDDFLGMVTTEWENAASKAEEFGIRTVFTRFGVILGHDKGALPFMSLPVKLFAGGKIGDGEQWLSWVHVDDVVDLIIFSLENKGISGPVNVTAPKPKRNKDFMRILAKVLRRPYWFTTPSLFMKVALGDMSQLITRGQYVLPEKSLQADYHFSHPDLEDALRSFN